MSLEGEEIQERVYSYDFFGSWYCYISNPSSLFKCTCCARLLCYDLVYNISIWGRNDIAFCNREADESNDREKKIHMNQQIRVLSVFLIFSSKKKRIFFAIQNLHKVNLAAPCKTCFIAVCKLQLICIFDFLGIFCNRNNLRLG